MKGMNYEVEKVGNATRLFQNYKRNVLWEFLQFS